MNLWVAKVPLGLTLAPLLGVRRLPWVPCMSLYAVQKFLYHLNREASVQSRWRDGSERMALLDAYELSGEERQAIERGDVGLLYVLGCNGQLLMHFAPLLGLAWPQYLEALREGVRRYGPVRAGVYAITTSTQQKVAEP